MQLSYAEMEAALARLHLIAESKRDAFRGRLKHLQRNGFPPNMNTGKGNRAAYSPEAIVQLAVAFELIQLGLAPDRAAKMVIGSWFDVATGMQLAAHHYGAGRATGGDAALMFTAESLRPLTADEEQPEDFQDCMALRTISGFPDFCLEKSSKGSIVASCLNLACLFSAILEALPGDGDVRSSFRQYWIDHVTSRKGHLSYARRHAEAD